MHFSALHKQETIGFFAYSMGIQGLKKAGPTSAAVKLGRRVEQRFTAANAVVYTCGFGISKFASKGTLGGLVPGYIESQRLGTFGGEQGAPFIVSFSNFGRHSYFQEEQEISIDCAQSGEKSA
jgi:hypothetical protein